MRDSLGARLVTSRHQIRSVLLTPSYMGWHKNLSLFLSLFLLKPSQIATSQTILTRQFDVKALLYSSFTHFEVKRQKNFILHHFDESLQFDYILTVKFKTKWYHISSTDVHVIRYKDYLRFSKAESIKVEFLWVIDSKKFDPAPIMSPNFDFFPFWKAKLILPWKVIEVSECGFFLGRILKGQSDFRSDSDFGPKIPS